VVGPVLAVLPVTRAVVITPLAEELLFRGALYGRDSPASTVSWW
jgi:membrane protease YdiL (CAAX protease family)